MKNKDKTFFSLYFGVFGIATGFLPFTALSLLFSFSKRNLVGNGVSALGKLGKNVLHPTLQSVLPGAVLAISALDLFVKDDASKTKEYLNKARDNNYENTTINNSSYYISEMYKSKNSYIDDYEPYKPVDPVLPDYIKMMEKVKEIEKTYQSYEPHKPVDPDEYY